MVAFASVAPLMRLNSFRRAWTPWRYGGLHADTDRHRDRVDRRRPRPHRCAGRPSRLDQPCANRRHRSHGAPRRRRHVRRRVPRRTRGAAGLARGARAGARPRHPAGGPARRGQQGGAGASGHARDRQAVPRVARRGPGDRRHLQLLPRRGPAPVRHDRARRRCPTSSCSRSACPSASPRSSPRATSRSPCRPGTSCPRCCAATRSSGSPPTTRRRPPRPSPSSSCTPGLPDGVLNLVLARRPDHIRRPRARARGRAGRQGRLHRLVGRRPAHRRAVRAPPAEPVPGARRQEPDGRDGGRRPGPRGRGRAVQRLRHGGPALHVPGHGHRPGLDPRRVPRAAHAARSGPRRSATPSRTSSTGR